MRHSPAFNTSLAFAGIAVICIFFADLEITTLNPWRELGHLFFGFLTPDFLAVEALGEGILNTIAFALLGVALGFGCGFMLSLVFHWRLIRWGCAFLFTGWGAWPLGWCDRNSAGHGSTKISTQRRGAADG